MSANIVFFIVTILAFLLIVLERLLRDRYSRVSVGETYEVMMMISDDKVIVADKDWRRKKFATPQQVFVDDKGVVHIVSPEDSLPPRISSPTKKEGW